jgi:hypothetical protein
MDTTVTLPHSAVDLGSGFAYTKVSWRPDRSLNPQYDGIPDVEDMGVLLWHTSEDGTAEVVGMVTFDLPSVRRIPGIRQVFWSVISLDPLHVEPSIQTYTRTSPPQPEFHGYIRQGRWQHA